MLPAQDIYRKLQCKLLVCLFLILVIFVFYFILGAQFGTVISMPLSGLLAEYGFSDGWPSIFYVFGAIGAIWSIIFIFTVSEDPETDPRIDPEERKFIMSALWGSSGVSSVSIHKFYL